MLASHAHAHERSQQSIVHFAWIFVHPEESVAGRRTLDSAGHWARWTLDSKSVGHKQVSDILFPDDILFQMTSTDLVQIASIAVSSSSYNLPPILQDNLQDKLQNMYIYVAGNAKLTQVCCPSRQ